MTRWNFSFADLHKSPLNVRTNAEDAEATAALEASIARVGLLQPLLVHAADDPEAPTPWAVLAGARRLRAVGRLIDAGTIPADWPIPAVIVDKSDAEITEMSLGENLLRRDLRPYEVHAAIAHAAAQGDSVGKIAASLGQSENWVRRQLRLGNLAPPIFLAYVAGELSFDQAAAFAATEDNALQLAVWDVVRHLPRWEQSAAAIRRAMKVGDREAAGLLLFVGEVVYLGAGGGFEADLFADGPGIARGRVTDDALLRRLAEERLAVERDRLRNATQRPALRFAAQPPQFSGRDDDALEFPGGPPPLADVPTDAILATLAVDEFGQPQARFWWASRAAKGAADKKRRAEEPGAARDVAGEGVGAIVARGGEALAAPDSVYSQSGREIARDQFGLTADGLQIIRSLRRALLRRLLLDQGGSVARDYLIWAQARALLAHDVHGQTGCRSMVSEWQSSDRPPQDLADFLDEDVPAEADWRAALDAIRTESFLIETDQARSLTLFLEAGQDVKNRTAAIVAGLALLRSANTPGWCIPAHDVLAAACAYSPGKLRRWWTPTAEWLGLFGKMFRLAAVQPFVDAATHTGFNRLKDGDLSKAAAAALDPENHRDAAVQRIAGRWLPAILTFNAEPPPEPAPPAAKAKPRPSEDSTAARAAEPAQ